MIRAVTLLSLLSTALCASERAQLFGVVEDSSGAVVAGVEVSAINEETGVRRSARSSERGVYLIPALRPGVYKATARRAGFQTVARLNVKVTPGSDARVDFVMNIGSMKEVITIEGGPPLINASDATVATLAGRNLIDALPLNGRGVLSLLDLSPGVIATPASAGEAGQFSVNGQRANTNYFTVDGVSANSSVTGGGLPAQFAGGALPAMTAFGTTQNLTSIEALGEVHVQTSSFAPEFGRLPGGQVALTTRSGSDEFHGSAYYLLRNTALEANDWFANSRGYGRSPTHLNNFGAVLGGPLRRNRTFFFASYEGLRLLQPYNWRTVTPSLATRRSAPERVRPLLDAFPLPSGSDLGGGLAELMVRAGRSSRLDTGSLRIDHALTSRVSLFGRYNQAPSSSEFGYAQVDQSEFRTRSFTLGVAAALSPSINNDVRVNVSSSSVASQWVATGAGGAKPFDLSGFFTPVQTSGSLLYGVAIPGTGQFLSGASAGNRQGQWNLVETLVLDRDVHALRLGADYLRLTPERRSAATTVAGLYSRLADVLNGLPPSVNLSRAEPASSLIEMLSLFFQDTWRIRPKLTLTYGLRWELTPPPSLRSPTTPAQDLLLSPAFLPLAPTAARLWPVRYSQLAPRIGAALRLAPRSVLRAGWGVFYDVGFGAATDPINGFPFNRWQFSSAVAAPARAAQVSGYGFAPDLAAPYALEWNVSYEHALSASDVASISYVGASGRRLLRREGTPQPVVNVADASVATNHGRSDHHALELRYKRRLARGFEGSAAYTWSHSLDNGSWDSGLALVQPGITAARDRGSSSFDVRHSLTSALSYELPRGWSVQGIFRARTGFPVDIVTSDNPLGLGFDNITRPNLNPGIPLWIPDASAPGGRQLNRAAFSFPVDSLQGNLGRNVVRGFGMSQLDAALQRRFPLSETAHLELRLEAFNLLNHANLADPVRFLDSPLFGQPSSMLNLMLGSGSPHSGVAPLFQIGSARSLQLTARLRF